MSRDDAIERALYFALGAVLAVLMMVYALRVTP
jgi:hypothetical protein